MGSDNKFRIDFSVKLRRFFAWVIDWVALSFLAAVIIGIVEGFDAPYAHGELMVVAAVLVIILGFAFRDPLLGGRSLGKRICRLGIVDKTTGGKPTGVRWAFRGILYVFYFFDGICIMLSGYSFGDMLGGTAVVDINTAKMLWADYYTSQNRSYTTTSEPSPAEKTPYRTPNSGYSANGGYTQGRTGSVLNGEYSVQNGTATYDDGTRKPKKKISPAVLVVLCFIIGIALIVGIAFTSLQKVKNTEEYKLAYEYLINSDYFESVDADEDDVSWRGYSYKYSFASETAEFAFSVKGKKVTVYCYKKNGEWVVDEEKSRLGGNRAEINEM